MAQRKAGGKPPATAAGRTAGASARERWTLASPRPPMPEDAEGPDGMFTFAQVGVFMDARVAVAINPVMTKQFVNALNAMPQLGDELNRLCSTYTADQLRALIDALNASLRRATPRPRRGPTELDLSSEQRVEIDRRRWLGQTDYEIALWLAPQLPISGDDDARLKRAVKHIKALPRREPSTTASMHPAIALQFWRIFHGKE